MDKKVYRTPRVYQVQLVQVARDRNSIIILPTGTGKTYIAVMIIQHFTNELNIENGKRTFFLVPTKPLVAQQADEIREHTTLKVAEFVGSTCMNGKRVDKWDKQMWDSQLSKYHVIVLTHDIFKNITGHAFVDIMSRVNLVIFDEAHWAGPDKKGKPTNHPYSEIMKTIKRLPKEGRPKILGLSACLVKSRIFPHMLENTMKDLEQTYEATCITCDPELLEGHGTDPKESICVYRSEDAPSVCVDVSTILNGIIKYMLHIKKLLKAQKRLKEIYDDDEPSLAHLPISLGDLRRSIQRTLGILERMGPWCAREAAIHYKEYLNRVLQIYKSSLPDFDTLVTCLSSVFGMVQEILTAFLSRKTTEEALTIYVSPKMLALLETLKRYEKKKLCGIVLVETRSQCRTLSNWLQAVSKCNTKDFDFLKVDYTVGTSARPGFLTALAASNEKQQEKILGEFRKGEKNLIVATSVLEEGLDVPECNLVLRYDAPKTFRSWLQSKGRARAKDAAYIMMSAKDTKEVAKRDIEYFHELEDEMNRLCRKRQEMRAYEFEIDLPYNEEPLVTDDEADLVCHSTGARINLRDAEMIVHMYCHRLPHDSYSRPAPLEKFERPRGRESEIYRCVILMPINSAVTEPVIGPWKSSKPKARQCAYLLLCKVLYELKELDEYLTPIRRRVAVADILKKMGLEFVSKIRELTETGAKPETKKRKQIYEKMPDGLMSGRVLSARNSRKYVFYEVKMDPSYVINEVSMNEKGLGLLYLNDSDTDRFKGCGFPVFNKNGHIDVQFEMKSNIIQLSVPQLDALKDFSKSVFQSALRFTRNEDIETNDDNIASYFVVPLTKCGAIDWETITAATHTDWLDNDLTHLSTVKYNDLEGKVVYTTYQKGDGFKYYRVIRVDSNQSPRSPFDDHQYKDYVHYYKEYHGITVNDINQPLLVAEAVDMTLSQITPWRSKQEQREFNKVHLIPELCKLLPIPPSFWYKLMSVPAIVFRLSRLLISKELKDMIQREAFGVDLSESEVKWESLIYTVDVKDDTSISRNLEVKDQDVDILTERKGFTAYASDGEDEVDDDHDDYTSSEDDSDDMTDDSEDEFSLEESLSQRLKKQLSVRCNEIEFDEPNIPEMLMSEITNQMSVQRSIEVNAFVQNTIQTLENCINNLMKYEGMEMEEGDSVVAPDDDLIKVDTSIPVDRRISSFDASRRSGSFGPNDQLILEALTAQKAKDFCNLERLEVIGDAFLKFAACAFLYFKYPLVDEGRLSFIKNYLVSNNHLCRLAREKSLTNYMAYERYRISLHYVPPGFNPKENVQEISDKAIADCVEAIIGAYLLSCGPLPAIAVMHWFGLKVSMESDDLLKCQHWLPKPPSPLSPFVCDIQQAEAAVEQQYRRATLACFENRIGYSFNNKGYLVQAFTHSSYYLNNATPCNQRLEFLGDAVIDYLVTRFIFHDKEHSFDPGQITHIRQALVNNSFLGSMAVKYGFHKHLMLTSHDAFSAISAFAKRFKLEKEKLILGSFLLVNEIESCTPEFIEVPKALGDVFEAVAGAIYLDSGLSLDAVFDVYYRLMRDELEYFSKNIPINPIRYLSERDASTTFSAPEVLGPKEVKVTITTCGKTYSAIGRNQKYARTAAAKRAACELINAQED